MPNNVDFAFSDTIAGYLTSYDDKNDVAALSTSDGRQYSVRLKSNTYAMVIRNLDEPYKDCTGQMRSMLTAGRYLFVYAIFMGDMAGDRSIYVYPAAGEPAQKLWRRYTLSRVGAAPELEGMARETFIAELGEEYAALIDPEVCPKCGQEVEADPDGAETPEPDDTLPPEAPTAAATPSALKE